MKFFNRELVRDSGTNEYKTINNFFILKLITNLRELLERR